MKIKMTAMAVALAFGAATWSVEADAGWKRITVEQTEVGKGAMMAMPETEWNRWSRRESKRGETWTKDGFQLNRLDFAGEIAVGDPIYKERKKKEKPLPKFRADMLPTDIAEMYESTFRIMHGVTEFNVRSLEPTKLGSADGVRLQFDYALPNDALVRVGEARLAVHDGELYMVSFIAPELHYFDASIGEVRTIMDGITLN